jgi:hypothetical protein
VVLAGVVVGVAFAGAVAAGVAFAGAVFDGAVPGDGSPCDVVPCGVVPDNWAPDGAVFDNAVFDGMVFGARPLCAGAGEVFDGVPAAGSAALVADESTLAGAEGARVVGAVARLVDLAGALRAFDTARVARTGPADSIGFGTAPGSAAAGLGPVAPDLPGAYFRGLGVFVDRVVAPAGTPESDDVAEAFVAVDLVAFAGFLAGIFFAGVSLVTSDGVPDDAAAPERLRGARGASSSPISHEGSAPSPTPPGGEAVIGQNVWPEPTPRRW